MNDNADKVVVVLGFAGTLSIYLYYVQDGVEVSAETAVYGFSILFGLLIMGWCINRWMVGHFAQKMMERVESEDNKRRVIDWYIGGSLKERLEIVEEIGSRVGGSAGEEE
jgi:nitric oxide reductase large subunit